MNFKDIITGILKIKSNDINIDHTEESQKMINFLLEDIYSDSSSINISNDSYHFAHENIIQKVNIYESITKKILDSPLNRKEMTKCLIKKEKLFLLEITFSNSIENLIIHYYVMNQLLKKYPKEINKIQEEINKIEESINKCQNLLKKIENQRDKYQSIVEISLQDNDYKEINNYYKDILKEGNIPFIDIEFKKYDYIFRSIASIEIDLESYFSIEDNQNEYINKLLEIENILLDRKEFNNNDFNNIKSGIHLIEKYTTLNTKQIKEKYISLLKLKYQYLKENYELLLDDRIQDDFIYDGVFFNFFIEEKIKRQSPINNKVFQFLNKYESEVLTDPILRSLFFYTINNSLLDWFELKINIKDYLKEKYIDLINNCKIKNISFKENTTIETFIYLMSEISMKYKELIDIHKYIIEKYGPTKEFLAGIESVCFQSDSMKELFHTISLSPDKNIIISPDVKIFSMNNYYRELSSNLIFQDGTESISMKNVHFENPVSITIPSTIKSLSIEIPNSNITKLIFNNYNNSMLFNNIEYLRSLLESFYSEDNESNDLEIIGKSQGKNASYTLSKSTFYSFRDKYHYLFEYCEDEEKPTFFTVVLDNIMKEFDEEYAEKRKKEPTIFTFELDNIMKEFDGEYAEKRKKKTL